ncbi:MAG TPA: alpha/beta hydrolase [Allosphingosinicella sp.]|nr:alpha/beta hydrolase [Allosphingosinicella sp.]
MLRSETAANPVRMQQALAGLRRYQEAARAPPRPPMPALAEQLGASLRDYGGSGPPVVFIPSLINPPGILDLSEERSLLCWLAARGHRPLLLDWGWEVGARQDLDVAGHVSEIAVPLVRSLGEPAALVGYCLGGTMALAAARPTGASGVATVAAPWHFSGFPDEARMMLAGLWRACAPVVDRLGVLPMEVLQSAFWSLDPARTVAKFEAFADMADGSPAAEMFVQLEDWANDGPPLSAAAARELFEGFFARDAPGLGRWGGDPAALPCPLLHIVSTRDRIVPAASAPPGGQRIDLAQGHVGMMIGRRAPDTLWAPLSAWLSRIAASC